MPDPASKNEQPEKLDLRSMDIAQARQEELLRLFPEIRTEGGKIDFDRLKLALGQTVDVGRERYGMNWPGKADCFKTIQTPSMGTLRPCPEESVNWDTTENLIIEGDNLEVLKLLQKSYLGKIKMIYIDPPYNTGNDFIYPDNYAESLETYLQYTGQVDTDGRKFGTNTDADGRFHSKWMSMMFPRLYLASNLLQEDGLLFVSIDDTEFQNLRRVLDEVFGEENFVDTIVWKKRYGGGAKEKHLVSVHEYIVVYARNKSLLGELFVPLPQESIDRYYKFRDQHFERRGPFRTHPLESMKSFGERKNLMFPITAPDGSHILPKRQWRWSPRRVEQAHAADEIYFAKDKTGAWTAHSKQYLKGEDGTRETKFFSVIDDVYTQHGTNEILSIFGDAQVFGFPKPSQLIAKLVQLATQPGNGDIVLDFFAGSGVTGDAILQLNQDDGGNRRFVLVQLPEPCDPESAAAKNGFNTIAEICKERVRRGIAKLKKSDEGKLEMADGVKPDQGFRVYKLTESNFKPWEADKPSDAAVLGEQMKFHVEHIRADRAESNLLYEILLKSGFALTTPVETLALADKKVYSIAGGALMLCLERSLTMEVLRAIADKKPERVVCLDAGFASNDQLKTNAVQIFKTKGVGSFKTV